jgi:hypothetical protein
MRALDYDFAYGIKLHAQRLVSFAVTWNRRSQRGPRVEAILAKTCCADP